MAGYELKALAKSPDGRALKGTVQFTAPDGRTETRSYAWPATVTRDELTTVCEDLYKRWLAEPPAPAPVHEAMDLVGKPQEVS